MTFTLALLHQPFLFATGVDFAWNWTFSVRVRQRSVGMQLELWYFRGVKVWTLWSKNTRLPR